MGLLYNKYTNMTDHSWYQSSNVLYSACMDKDTSDKKDLIIIFKGGATYMYRNVDINDYIMFKSADSQGKYLPNIIRKYECIKLDITSLEDLDKMREEFEKETQLVTEALQQNGITYNMKYNDQTGEFQLYLNDKCIFEGVEGEVSVVKLLRCMNINYTMEQIEL